MNNRFRHREIGRLLRLLRTRDLSKDEWSHLDSYADNDPFLLDALEGLKQLPADIRIGHIKAIMSRRTIDKRRRKKVIGMATWVSVAASVLVLVGMFWLVNRFLQPDDLNQIAENTSQENDINSNRSNGESDTALYTDIPGGGLTVLEIQSDAQPSRSIPTAPGAVAEKKEKDMNRTSANSSGSSKAADSDDKAIAESGSVEESGIEPTPPARASQQSTSPVADEALNLLAAPFPEVKGIVMNYVGEPLGGAQVQIKGTALQTQTDYEGNFALDIPNQNYRNALIISHQGYPPVEADVADGDSIVVRLQEYTSDGKSDVQTLAQRRMSTAGGPPSRSLAQPVSGEKSYNKYIRQNLRYPTAASTAGIHGSVILEFDIASDGAPYNFRITKSLGYGCDEEAIRLIREGPKWNIREAQVNIGRWEIKF